MRVLRGCLAGLTLFVGVSFACLNAEVVQVDFYVRTYPLPLSLLLVLTLGLGLFLGFLGFGFHYCRLRNENRKLKNQLIFVEQEVSHLRILPLKNND